MDSLLNNIEKIGIRIVLPRPKGSLCYNGQFYDLPEKSQVIFFETLYEGNAGFIKVESGDFTAVLLKSVFKDFITIISGTPNIDPLVMVKIAETALAIEKEVGTPVRVGLFAADNSTRYVFQAETLPLPDNELQERRLINFNACFTKTEYSLAQTSEASGGYLYGRGALSGFFPETVSPFTESYLKDLTQLFNPLPMSVNIKTLSPSLSTICGKVFNNTTALEPICETTGTSDSYYLLNYLPWHYLKSNKHVFKVPNLKVFAIDDAEIAENLDELRQTATSKLTEDMITNGGLIEIFALFAMTAQLVQLKLWESSTKFLASLNDIETMLKFVYLTREKSLLDEELNMPPYLDPMYPPMKLSIAKPFLKADFAELFAALPLTKRLLIGKQKLYEQLVDIHKCLDLKDDYTKSLFALVGNIHSLIMEKGNKMVEGRHIKMASDIFAFEMADMSRFLKNNFYGNVQSNLYSKNIKWERSKAQLMPYDIFERDIDNIAHISARVSAKIPKEVPCLSFFHKDYTGQGKSPVKLNDQLEDIALITNFSPVLLASLDKCKAVVTDTAPLFSYLTEYCTRTNTPLYTGVRFAGLFYKDRKIHLTKESIKITD